MARTKLTARPVDHSHMPAAAQKAPRTFASKAPGSKSGPVKALPKGEGKKKKPRRAYGATFAAFKTELKDNGIRVPEELHDTIVALFRANAHRAFTKAMSMTQQYSRGKTLNAPFALAVLTACLPQQPVTSMFHDNFVTCIELIDAAADDPEGAPRRTTKEKTGGRLTSVGSFKKLGHTTTLRVGDRAYVVLGIYLDTLRMRLQKHIEMLCEQTGSTQLTPQILNAAVFKLEEECGSFEAVNTPDLVATRVHSDANAAFLVTKHRKSVAARRARLAREKAKAEEAAKKAKAEGVDTEAEAAEPKRKTRKARE